MAVTRAGKTTFIYENFAVGVAKQTDKPDGDLAIIFTDEDNEERHIFQFAPEALDQFVEQARAARGKKTVHVATSVPRGAVFTDSDPTQRHG